MKTETKNALLQLIIALAGIFILLFGVILFNQHLFMKLSLEIRVVIGIAVQWIPAIVPLIIALICKDRPKDFGFTKNKIGSQILIGLCIALVMSFILTIFPLLLGFKNIAGDKSYTQAWQFLYEFAYCIIGVALAEEFIFRGFVFNRIMRIKPSKWMAVVLSSAAFGLYHIFIGNLIQVMVTMSIGIVFCLCREKLKNCSTLSLIIAHGVYDASIILWASIF